MYKAIDGCLFIYLGIYIYIFWSEGSCMENICYTIISTYLPWYKQDSIDMLSVPT